MGSVAEIDLLLTRLGLLCSRGLPAVRRVQIELILARDVQGCLLSTAFRSGLGGSPAHLLPLLLATGIEIPVTAPPAADASLGGCGCGRCRCDGGQQTVERRVPDHRLGAFANRRAIVVGVVTRAATKAESAAHLLPPAA